MADGTTSSSISQVQSSYSDVNTALEKLIGNMSSGSSYDAKSAIENLQNQLNNFVGTNPVGTVLAFTTNTIPDGYLLCNGATFSQTNFPSLYTALRSATLPDLRGMFLRGLDTTGSVDNFSGTRTLLSFEEGSYQTADVLWDHSDGFSGQSAQNLQWDNISGTVPTWGIMASTGGTGVPYNGEIQGVSRPKNIAVNYIIKAVP